MAAVTKSSKPDIETRSAMTAVKVQGLLSGDSFAFLAPVYIDSTGVVKAAVEDSTAALYDGFATEASDSAFGTPVGILAKGAILEWIDAADSILPGTLLYVDSLGGLATDSQTLPPVAKTITATKIIVLE